MPRKRIQPQPRSQPINGRREDNYIISIENGGEWMDIHYVRDNGEKVIGAFKRIGWCRPPREVFDDTMQRLSNPPRVIYHPKAKRGQGPMPRGPAEAESDEGDP
jgi:hypothetical protein